MRRAATVPALLYSLALVLPILLRPAPARATVILPIPVEEMTRTADEVVQGRVTKVESRYSEDRSQIFTYITLSDAEGLKGNPGRRVVFVQWGGRVGDDVLRVFGAPEFTSGEEVVVFLTRMTSNTPLAYPTDRWLLGMSQGKWDVTTDPATGARIAVKSRTGAEVVTTGPNAVPTTLSLGDLRRRIRGAATLESLRQMGGN